MTETAPAITSTPIAAAARPFQKAIVFGGAGFIGSHTLQRLATDYPQAQLYSVDIAEPRFKVPGVTYLHHDLRTPIPTALCGAGPALIFNFAAVHTTPGHEDWEYYWTNVLDASHVCQYATTIGADEIVFTSSISVYGPSEEPKDETSVLEPNSAYGRSKALSEKIHQLWQTETSGRRLIIVRPAVIYGLTERGNFTRLAKLMAKRRFVYPGRKDTIKSCGYVKDLVSSMLYMRGRPEAVSIYNFCYPDRYTSEDICTAFSDVAAYGAPRGVVPIQAMLLAGLGFEVLNRLGLKNTVNRARVRKLFHSTNILPTALKTAGFQYGFDLKSSLADWQKTSPNKDFA